MSQCDKKIDDQNIVIVKTATKSLKSVILWTQASSFCIVTHSSQWIFGDETVCHEGDLMSQTQGPLLALLNE